MQSVSTTFFNALTGTPKKLAFVVELYHQDAVPASDGFDPASADFLIGFADRDGITYKTRTYDRLLLKVGRISRTLKKQLSDASFILSNLTREAYEFERDYGFEGLICVVRLIDTSVSTALADSCVLFTGRCEKPDNFSRANESVGITVKQILNQTEVAVPRRRFTVEDNEGRTFSDPEFEGFRFVQRFGSLRYQERVGRGGILGLFGLKKTVTRFQQYSSQSDADAETFVPLILGRVQMQGINWAFEDQGTFIQMLTIFADGYDSGIGAIENIRSVTPGFPLTAAGPPNVKLGELGGTGDQTNSQPNWVAAGIYSRTAYMMAVAHGTEVENDDVAPDTVGIVFGLKVAIPDASGDYTVSEWSDNPVHLSRWALNNQYVFGLASSWLADDDMVDEADYCDQTLEDKSNSETLQINNSQSGIIGTDYNYFRSSSYLSPDYFNRALGDYDPFLEENDYNFFTNEPRNPDDLTGTGFPSYAITAIPAIYRRRYTSNVLVQEEQKAIDFLFDVLFPSANLYLTQKANGKLAVKVARPADFTFMYSASAIGASSLHVRNINKFRENPGKVLIGANLSNSEVREVISTSFDNALIPISASGGISSSGATLANGDDNNPSYATLTVSSASGAKTVTIDNYQMVYTPTGGETINTTAAMIAEMINAHEVLNKYIKAIWNEDATVRVESRAGTLNLDAPLEFAHATGIAGPTTAPTLSAQAGGTFEAGTYYVYYSYQTAAGETLVSPHTAITIAINQFIRVGAITLPAGATQINYYCSIEAEGIRPHYIGSGDGSAFDITVLPSIDARIEPNHNSTAEEIHRVHAVFTDKANTRTGLTGSNMLKGSFKFPIGNRQPSTNQVEIKFRDASQDFRLSELRVNDRTHQDKVKKVNKKEINGQAIDSYHQAKRIANQSLAQWRDGDLFQTLSSDGEALLLEEGDIICVTDESGEFVNEPLRVEDVDINDSNGYPTATITGRKYRRYYYDDQVTEKLVPIPVVQNNANNLAINKPVIYQYSEASNTAVEIGVNNYTSAARYRKVEVAEDSGFTTNLVTTTLDAEDYPNQQLPATFRVTKDASANAETRYIRVSHSSNNIAFSEVSDTLTITFADSGGSGGTGGTGPGAGNPPTPSPGPGCFFAGTSVFGKAKKLDLKKMKKKDIKDLKETGKEKHFNIEEIEPGDLVCCFDEKGKTYFREVSQVFEHIVFEHIELIFDDGTRIKTTREHPFWTEDKNFVGAGRLQKYQSVSVIDDKGKWQTKQLISRIIIPGEVTVYNIEVEEFHTYFADGFAVHNLKEVPIDE